MWRIARMSVCPRVTEALVGDLEAVAAWFRALERLTKAPDAWVAHNHVVSRRVGAWVGAWVGPGRSVGGVLHVKVVTGGRRCCFWAAAANGQGRGSSRLVNVRRVGGSPGLGSGLGTARHCYWGFGIDSVPVSECETRNDHYR